MSGPITPPLTVTTASGTPSGRPITTIKVSDGDLTISGNVATIDTSGSGGSPGGSTTEIQYNNAGAFAGDAGFVMQTIGAGTGTVVDIGGIRVGGSNYAMVAKTLNTSLLIQPEGSGQLTISSGDVGGGTKTDMQVNVQKQATTDEAIIELKAGIGTIDIARIKLDGSSDLILDNSYNTDKDLDLKIGGTGQVEIENQTTDNDTTLSVKGNGTGDAIINLNNPTKSAQLICDTNQKLKVQGGLNTFIFDASSATGGITWPDGTTQITAASGGGAPEVGYKTSYWYNPYLDGSWGAATTTLTADRIYLMPIYFNKDVNIDRIAVYVGSAVASSNIRVGLYNVRTSNGLFATKITDGTATADANGWKEITVSESLTQGYYWAAIQTDDAIGVTYNSDGGNQAPWAVRSGGSAASQTSSARYWVSRNYSSGMNTDLTGENPADEEWYPFIFNVRVA